MEKINIKIQHDLLNKIVLEVIEPCLNNVKVKEAFFQQMLNSINYFVEIQQSFRKTEEVNFSNFESSDMLKCFFKYLGFEAYENELDESNNLNLLKINLVEIYLRALFELKQNMLLSINKLPEFNSLDLFLPDTNQTFDEFLMSHSKYNQLKCVLVKALKKVELTSSEHSFLKHSLKLKFKNIDLEIDEDFIFNGLTQENLQSVISYCLAEDFLIYFNNFYISIAKIVGFNFLNSENDNDLFNIDYEKLEDFILNYFFKNNLNQSPFDDNVLQLSLPYKIEFPEPSNWLDHENTVVFNTNLFSADIRETFFIANYAFIQQTLVNNLPIPEFKKTELELLLGDERNYSFYENELLLNENKTLNNYPTPFGSISIKKIKSDNNKDNPMVIQAVFNFNDAKTFQRFKWFMKIVGRN